MVFVYSLRGITQRKSIFFVKLVTVPDFFAFRQDAQSFDINLDRRGTFKLFNNFYNFIRIKNYYYDLPFRIFISVYS